MCLTGENIGASAVEAEAELAWFSPGNGSHRLLLYLTASRLALQPSLFFMAAASEECLWQSQQRGKQTSGQWNTPHSNGLKKN